MAESTGELYAELLKIQSMSSARVACVKFRIIDAGFDEAAPSWHAPDILMINAPLTRGRSCHGIFTAIRDAKRLISALVEVDSDYVMWLEIECGDLLASMGKLHSDGAVIARHGSTWCIERL